MKIKKLIVTGHRGFIATNFINNVSDNYEIYGIDVLLKGSNNFQTDGRKKLKKEYIFNLSNDKLYDELKNDFNSWSNVCVVHFAAYSHVDDSIKSPDLIVNGNIYSTYKIAKFCAENNIPFVNISTDEVYGELGINDSPFQITDFVDPRNPYSASKACNEILIKSLKHQYPNWNIIQTRCVNNFGPYQDPTKLIPVCILSILNNKKIPIYGQGLQRRTWIPVDVHNKIVLNLIEDIFNKSYQINMLYNYNIGSDIELSNIELIQNICDIMNVNINDNIEFVQDPRGNSHDFRYSINFKTIYNKYHDLYNFNFIDKLKETIEFYKKNKDNLNLWN